MLDNLKSLFPVRTKEAIKVLLRGSEAIYENRWGFSLNADVIKSLQVLEKSDYNALKTIFDVGANIGQTSIALAHSFPNANILAFEPAHDTYNYLCNSVNNFHNIKTYNLAFGSKIGTQTLYCYGDKSPLNSLVLESPVMSSNLANNSYSVILETIDNFCKTRNIDKIDLLKLDTEGFDFEVLKGASELIANACIQFIYFEFFITDKQIKKESQGGNLYEIMDYLLSQNYRMISFYTDFVNPEVSNSHHNALMMLKHKN